MEQSKCHNCTTLNNKYASKCQSCGMPLSIQKKIIKKKMIPETKALILVVSPFIISLIGAFGLFKELSPVISIFLVSTFNIMIIIGFTMSILQRNARNIFISLIAFSWIIIINVGLYFQLV